MAGWRDKIKASAHGDVAREPLEAYHTAGGGVYSYLLELDALRASVGVQANVQVTLLAGWIAFTHQVIGDEMLAANPAPYVSRATAAQVMELYEPVAGWMARARAARANPAYRIDVPLPQLLPPWVEVHPIPPEHLVGLRNAVDRLRQQESAVAAGFAPGTLYKSAAAIVSQGSAEADSMVEYASGLWGSGPTPPAGQVPEGLESSLKGAIETYFYLGQIVSMPILGDVPRPVRPPPPPGPGPGGPTGFFDF